MGLNVAIGVYAGLYLPLRGLDYEEVLGDRVHIIGATSGMISFISYLILNFRLTIAVWKVYSWWTLPLIFLLFMGFIMSSHFVPNNQFGSYIFSFIFLLVCFSAYIIEHEGYLHTSHEQFD